MTSWHRLGFVTGALTLAAGVGLSAWHAHGLVERLTPEDWESFGRALEQQNLAALGLLAAGLLGTRGHRWLSPLAAGAMLIGLILFSGSLYLRILGGFEGASRVAPAGGTLQILGWLLLGLAALFGPGKSWSRHPDSNWG